MALNTRPPTGNPAWPIILIDGRCKTGVTHAALRLSASEHVGRVFVFEFGGRAADSYTDLGDYEIVQLDGTWADFHTQLIAATLAERVHPDIPNVIIIDTISRIWNDLGLWVEKRARSSDIMKERLRADPNAMVDTSGYWTDAKARWAVMLRLLEQWEGISVLCARGDDAAVYENGVPVPGASAYRIAVEKTTLSNVTYQVTTTAPGVATLTAANNPAVTVGIELPADNALEHLLFDIVGLDTVKPEPRAAVGIAPGPSAITAIAAKQWLTEFFIASGYDKADAEKAGATVWTAEFPSRPALFEIPHAAMQRLTAAAHAAIDTPPAADGDDTPADVVPAPETTATGPVDPVAEAAAFVAAAGGNPDAPSADPADVAEFVDSETEAAVGDRVAQD